MNASNIFATFSVDGLLFGVPAAEVMELTPRRELTRVPLAPPTIEGLMNLRGQIIAAVEMRRRLELRPRAAGEASRNVVLRTEDGPVSLLVDQIGEVIELGEEMFEPVPETLRGIAREMVRGVYKLPGRLLLILDPRKVLDLPATPHSRKPPTTPATP
jgi:purine-binding chemotaxis protein CheW